MTTAQGILVSDLFEVRERGPSHWVATCSELGIEAWGTTREKAVCAAIDLLMQRAEASPELKRRFNDLVGERGSDFPPDVDPGTAAMLLQVPGASERTLNDELNGDRPVLLEFWAPWCKPCLALVPPLAHLASDYSEVLAVRKVDVERQPKIARRFGIKSLPQMILFHKGRQIKRWTQVNSVSLVAEVTQALATAVGPSAVGSPDLWTPGTPNTLNRDG